MKKTLKFLFVLGVVALLGLGVKSVVAMEESEGIESLIKDDQANRYGLWGNLKKGCKSKIDWTCDLR